MLLSRYMTLKKDDKTASKDKPRKQIVKSDKPDHSCGMEFHQTLKHLKFEIESQIHLYIQYNAGQEKTCMRINCFKDVC